LYDGLFYTETSHGGVGGLSLKKINAGITITVHIIASYISILVIFSLSYSMFVWFTLKSVIYLGNQKDGIKISTYTNKRILVTKGVFFGKNHFKANSGHPE